MADAAAVDEPPTVELSPAARRMRWPVVDDALTLPGFEQRVVHPEFAGMEFLHVQARTILNRVPAGSSMPFSWTINAYRGCSHACTYCFARPSHEWLELDADQDFERVIVVKINAVERVRAELRSARWKGEHVAMGTNTDPYQRCEGRYRLTRGIVTALAEAGNPFSILTKSALITRDLDVLADASRRGVCRGIALSIGTLDDDVWRLTEPAAPHPARRLEAIAQLTQAGVETNVMLAPIIPGLSDDPAQLRTVIAGALEAGARAINPIVLHLRPGVREVFLDRLKDQRPDLAKRLAATYRGSSAPVAERQRIIELARRIASYLGAPGLVGERQQPAPSPRSQQPSTPRTTPAPKRDQLALF